jgi:SAM-dependent methyltransferase
VSDKETIDLYTARASDYADLIGKATAPDTQLQSFLDHLPENADVLDLGCGPAGAAALMAKAGHRAIATDASPGMIELANQQPGVTARLETFDDIAGDAIYDGVWANFSLLHAAREDLPRHLSAIAQTIKPGGIFHIGMKTGTDTDRDALGRRYTFVTHEELAGLLSDVGLVEFTHWTGREKGFAGTLDPWIVIQARKSA